jgi:hypothetical protein
MRYISFISLGKQENAHMNLLNPSQREVLIKPVRHDTGGFDNWHKSPRKRPLIVDIDACPLVNLIEDASQGHRVYEFMSINRPGDLKHYLRVNLVEVDEDIVKKLESAMNRIDYSIRERQSELTELPYTVFDNHFMWEGDDSTNDVAAWRQHIDQSEWKENLSAIYGLVMDLQTKLRATNDFLLQHEIGLLDSKQHFLDFMSRVERFQHLDSIKVDWSANASFFDYIRNLIAKPEVTSVACGYNSYPIWRILCEEQIRRAKSSGDVPGAVFRLYAADDCCYGDVGRNWGAEIHTSYEGMVIGDVTILPQWRRFDVSKAGEGGSLSAALRTSDSCQFLLIPSSRDFGEIACANRTELDGWIVYSQI